MKKLLLIILFTLFICGCRNITVDRDKLLGYDYRLFQETPSWNLAKAVQDGDTAEIKRIVRQERIDVNYTEPKFGQSLLVLSVLNQNYNSCKALLESGANPNQHDSYDGTSAIIEAAGIQNIKGNNTAFLKLMLQHGGNPNDEEVGKRGEGNSTRKTPLLEACENVNQVVSPIDKVKMLVEAGADVNHRNEFKAFPLCQALIMEHYDVALYLLQRGADYSMMLFDRAEFEPNGKKIYIQDYLREQCYPLDSKKYMQKMEVVEFLKQKGIDYQKVPIPDYVIKEAKKDYPNNWEEYLNKY